MDLKNGSLISNKLKQERSSFPLATLVEVEDAVAAESYDLRRYEVTNDFFENEFLFEQRINKNV